MTYNNRVTLVIPVTARAVLNVTTNSSGKIPEHCLLTSSSDGSGDIITPETELLIDKLKSAVIIPLLYLFAGPANILNMAVFFKQGLNDRVNLCLFSLAVVDFVFLSFYFVLYVEHVFMFNSPETHGTVDIFLTNNKILLFYGSSYGAMFLTVIISLERCFCVLVPLRAKTLLKTKSMATIILIGVPTATFLRLLVLAKYSVVCVFDSRRQLALMGLSTTEYQARNKDLLNFIDGILYGFIFSLGCPVVVLIASCITIVKLWQTVAWRKTTSSANTRKETAITKMLVVLSLTLVVFNLPRIWVRTYPLFNSDFSTTGRYRYFFLASTVFGEIGLYMGSSFSFIVYYFSSSKYRQTCRSLFETRCLKDGARKR